MHKTMLGVATALLVAAASPAVAGDRGWHGGGWHGGWHDGWHGGGWHGGWHGGGWHGWHGHNNGGWVGPGIALGLGVGVLGGALLHPRRFITLRHPFTIHRRPTTRRHQRTIRSLATTLPRATTDPMLAIARTIHMVSRQHLIRITAGRLTNPSLVINEGRQRAVKGTGHSPRG